MNKGYILKAEGKHIGTVYYMNAICLTEQKECAEVFPNYEEAEDNVSHFKNMFHYDQPKITIEAVNDIPEDITFVNKIEDYGVKREFIKRGNKILGWIEQYTENNANDDEKGKWFFVIGKPSQKYPTQYPCNTEEEAREKLLEAIL